MDEIIKIKDLKFKRYITEIDIKNRVKILADAISEDYQSKNPILLLTLKGAIIFAADLMREITIPLHIETIIAKSYGMEIESSGNVEIIENKVDFKDRHVIIIEDIVDTGNTMFSLINRLKKFNPESIEICTLLFKPQNLEIDVDVKYTGFEIAPIFVVGYGLDYAEEGRNLKDIYIKFD